MVSVEDRQRKRDDYLVALYDLADGSTTQWPTHREIAEQAGLTEDEAFPVGQSVCDQGFAEFKTMGGLDGHVAVTSLGVNQAEHVITKRESRNEPRILGLALFTDLELRRELEPLLSQLEQALDSATNVDQELMADVRADIDATSQALRASHPNRGVIRATLSRLKSNWSTLAVNAAIIIPAVDIILRRLGY